MARAERGRQVLAAGDERAEEPRRRGCADRPSSTARRAFRTRSPPSFPQATVQTCIVHLLRHSPWISSPGRTVSPWRPRSRTSTGPSTPRPPQKRAHCLRGTSMGPEIRRHRSELAARLGARFPVLCLSRRCPADSLHHKCHRGAELQAPRAVIRAGGISPATRRRRSCSSWS